MNAVSHDFCIGVLAALFKGVTADDVRKAAQALQDAAAQIDSDAARHNPSRICEYCFDRYVRPRFGTKAFFRLDPRIYRAWQIIFVYATDSLDAAIQSLASVL